ncbi:MAG: hypothetical protein ACREH8_18130, partial [Opitutaceae bacterium]
MKNIHWLKWIAVAVAALAPSVVQAQLFIDQAGARDVFFSAGDDFTSKGGVLRLKLDLGDKSASAAYFAGLTNLADGFVTVGFTAKAKSPDDLSELYKLKRVPSAEGAVVANWTSRPKQNATTFVNLRAAYKHDRYTLYDAAQPAGNQVTSPDFDGGSVHLAAGLLKGGNKGAALSFGYERSTNYEDLDKVTVLDTNEVTTLPNGESRAVGGKSKTARRGPLERLEEYPLTLLGHHDLPGPAVDEFMKKIPVVPKANVTYGAIFALYGRMTWFKHGSSREDVGASLTLRREKSPPVDPRKTTQMFDTIGSAVDFPLGFYIERRSLSGRGEPETKTGAVIV